MALAIGLLCAALPRGARASQFLLLDAVVTEKGTAYDGHSGDDGARYTFFSPQLNQPKNWRSPIDYTKGTVYYRIEVLTKPSDATVCYGKSLWFYPLTGFHQSSDNRFGCSPNFTQPGVYNTSHRMNTIGNFGNLDFTYPMDAAAFTLYKGAGGAQVGRADPMYFPTMVRFSITVVSEGDTYAPPPGTTIGADGGADAQTRDASADGVPPDAAAAGPPTHGPADVGAPVVDLSASPPDAALAVVDTRPAPAPTGPPADQPMAEPASAAPRTPSHVSGACAIAGSTRTDGPAAAPGWLLVVAVSLLRWRRR